MDIKNDIYVTNFNFTATAKLQDHVQQNVYNDASITAYGVKPYKIDYKSSGAIFLYDSDLYAAFLAQHYLMLYREPPTKLDMSTDMIGYNWDVKSLMGIRERTNLNLDCSVDTSVLTGVFEVYEMRFDTRKFEIGFGLRWAGFLLAPDGDIDGKRWAFWDNFYFDEDVNGIEYSFW
jgi:hypothetical protein